MLTIEDYCKELKRREEQERASLEKQGIPGKIISYMVKSPYFKIKGERKILEEYKLLRQRNIPEIAAAVIASSLRSSKLAGEQGLDKVIQAFLIAFDDYPAELAAGMSLKDAKDL